MQIEYDPGHMSRIVDKLSRVAVALDKQEEPVCDSEEMCWHCNPPFQRYSGKKGLSRKKMGDDDRNDMMARAKAAMETAG